MRAVRRPSFLFRLRSGAKAVLIPPRPLAGSISDRDRGRGVTGTFAHDALKGVVYADDQVLLLFGESLAVRGRPRSGPVAASAPSLDWPRRQNG